MHKLLPLTMVLGLSAAGCSIYFEGDDTPGTPGTPESPSTDCFLHTTNPLEPGYPFDAVRFNEQVWPVLEAQCSSAGCHAPGNTFAFTVWPSNGDDCSMVASFNSFYENTSLDATYGGSPYQSRVIQAIDGSMPTHPIRYASSDSTLSLLSDYIQQALWVYGGGAEPAPYFYFDYDVFAQDIQPMLDSAQCTVIGCHARESNGFGLSLTANPGFGSPEMQENLDQVVSYIDLTRAPTSTSFFQHATNNHAGAQISDPAILEQWIAQAIEVFMPAPLQ